MTLLKNCTLISVHVPKCAGTSFRPALKQLFGENNVYFDYQESPLDPRSPIYQDRSSYLTKYPQHPPFLRNKLAIHGHFHVLKYQQLENTLRITVLRDPVERVISHYFFWKIHPRHGHPLHNYMLDHNLSLLEFAQLPSMRHFYTQIFFSDVDMQSFAFIGNMHKPDEVLAFFENNYGRRIVFSRKNENTHAFYTENKKEALSDNVLMHKLRDLLKEDLVFYERWTSP